MKTVTWLPFCVSNATTRTGVHFFPAADNVTAPYPANCALTLFGGSAQMRTVVLEGGRLSNPDGVRLEDAFPELKNDLNGIFGLAVEISSAQPRLNLSGSGCIIEFNSRGYHSRYWPAMVIIPDLQQDNLRARFVAKAASAPHGQSTPGTQPSLWRTGMALHDTVHHSSVVVINGGELPAKVYSDTGAASEDQPAEGTHKILLTEIAPHSIIEVPLADSFYENALNQECSWGRLKARAVTLSVELAGVSAGAGESSSEAAKGPRMDKAQDFLSSAVVSYMLYRDAGSRRIVSVNAM